MTKQEILTHIDHTQLKAFCTWENIKKLCDEAIKYNTASVCIPLSYIERIKETYGDKINICTVTASLCNGIFYFKYHRNKGI